MGIGNLKVFTVRLVRHQDLHCWKTGQPRTAAQSLKEHKHRVRKSAALVCFQKTESIVSFHAMLLWFNLEQVKPLMQAAALSYSNEYKQIRGGCIASCQYEAELCVQCLTSAKNG